MGNVPARCLRCGHVFNSPFGIGGRNSFIIGCNTNCPKCGGEARVFDAHSDSEGNIHFYDTAFRVLSNPAIPVKSVESLQLLLHDSLPELKEGKKQQSELIETIQHNLPELDEVTKLLIPTDAGDFYSFASFLLGIATVIAALRRKNKNPQPTIINNFINTPNPEEVAYRIAHEYGALGRNSPCPCGSGKKFKKCHGKKQ